MPITLFDLPINKNGIIKKISGPFFIRERLHRLGIIRGTVIKPIKSTPLGTPRVYEYLHTQVAIRNNLAKKIQITLNY